MKVLEARGYLSSTPGKTRVLYADTDRSGLVYHTDYFRFFELERTSLMERFPKITDRVRLPLNIKARLTSWTISSRAKPFCRRWRPWKYWRHPPRPVFRERPFIVSGTPEYQVSVETIYKKLVPFGPAYHNLKEWVSLFEKGAEATVCAPLFGGLPIPLGSPFPLDAAFHAACVWGQRYAGLVGFPVGFALHRLFAPTRSGSTYTAGVFPKKIHPDRFFADIWITGMDGALQEVVLDVVMKDVSGGRVKLPSWILA